MENEEDLEESLFKELAKLIPEATRAKNLANLEKLFKGRGVTLDPYSLKVFNFGMRFGEIGKDQPLGVWGRSRLAVYELMKKYGNN